MPRPFDLENQFVLQCSLPPRQAQMDVELLSEHDDVTDENHLYAKSLGLVGRPVHYHDIWSRDHGFWSDGVRGCPLQFCFWTKRYQYRFRADPLDIVASVLEPGWAVLHELFLATDPLVYTGLMKLIGFMIRTVVDVGIVRNDFSLNGRSSHDRWWRR